MPQMGRRQVFGARHSNGSAGHHSEIHDIAM